MDDHAERGSRRGWRRFFRAFFLASKWLIVAILAVLLVAGLIVKAPWRVNTLLAFLILTPAVVPRRVRKHVYLVFAAVVASVAVWVFLPEDDAGWGPYVFEEDLAAVRDRMRVPDDENAATIYKRLLAACDYDFYDSHALQCLPPDTSEDARLLMQFQATAGPNADVGQTLAAVVEAAQRPQCRFEVPYGPLQMGDQFEHLRAMRLWTRLLETGASQDMAAGCTSDALAKCSAMFRMADHMYQQGTPLDYLVGAAIEGTAISPAATMVMSGRLDRQQLADFDAVVAAGGFDWQTDFPRLLDYEKLWAKQTAASMYERHTNGMIRRRVPYTLFGAAPQAAPKARTRRDKMAAVFVWLIWPLPNKISEIVDRNFAHCYAMADPNYTWSEIPARRPVRFTMLAALHPYEHSFPSLHEIHLRSRSVRGGVRILVRLERMRQAGSGYPDSLEGIVGDEGFLCDRAARDTFIYRPGADSFVLYHTGSNGVDDNGVFDRRRNADDKMIWPIAR